MIKTILKLLGGLLIGVAAGLLIAGVGVVLFTDTTFSEFLANLSGSSLRTYAIAIAGMLALLLMFVLSFAILATVHEAGHLVCGLLSSYKFVSFRVFDFTFIKIGGKIRVKRFSVAGTGGQCLMSPPDVPLSEMPVVLYNAGGILANVIVLVLILPVFLLGLPAILYEALLIFCLTDILLILMNGIPMKLSGIGNDAYNMLHLAKNQTGKKAMVVQLRTNALVQEGVRPKDMPAEWFEWNDEPDYRNPFEVSLPLMYASRLIDEMDFDLAYDKFKELYSHKSDIIQLYVNEIACELAFCAMILGRRDEAESLIDSKLRTYIDTYRKVMSSKLRILCAYALYVENDRAKALAICDSLRASQDKYLLKGEVESDLAIMDRMFAGYAQV